MRSSQTSHRNKHAENHSLENPSKYSLIVPLMANKHLWTNTVQYRDQAMVTSLATSTAKTVLEIYYLLLYIIYYILLYITIYYYILYIIYYYILYIYSLIGNTWAKCVANNTLAPRPQGPKAPRPQGSKAPKPQGPKAPRLLVQTSLCKGKEAITG